MNSKARIPAVLAAMFTWALLAAGCASVSVDSRPYLGLPAYPPTDPATVSVLREMPARPLTKLGDITLIPDGEVPVQQLEQKLREAASKMGADAVVLTSDDVRRSAISFRAREIRPEHERIITAVAVKYAQP